MRYVISDVHNNLAALELILKRITENDKDYHLYFLGNLFDRAEWNPDPIGIYRLLKEMEGHASFIRGNHDDLLAKYIRNYYDPARNKHFRYKRYRYNSFEILRKGLKEEDMLKLADMILSWPLQEEICVSGTNYLLAHARTSSPQIKENDDYYLTGGLGMDEFFMDGIEGYVSVVGHTRTDKVWRNQKQNVIMLDTGCGFKDGRLSCLCLENKKIIQSITRQILKTV